MLLFYPFQFKQEICQPIEYCCHISVTDAHSPIFAVILGRCNHMEVIHLYQDHGLLHGSIGLQDPSADTSSCRRSKRKHFFDMQYNYITKSSFAYTKSYTVGQDNESNACATYMYLKYMQSNGLGLHTKKAGFVAHPERFWLCASLDAWVIDPFMDCSSGIAEFKCLFSMVEYVN